MRIKHLTIVAFMLALSCLACARLSANQAPNQGTKQNDTGAHPGKII